VVKSKTVITLFAAFNVAALQASRRPADWVLKVSQVPNPELCKIILEHEQRGCIILAEILIEWLLLNDDAERDQRSKSGSRIEDERVIGRSGVPREAVADVARAARDDGICDLTERHPHLVASRTGWIYVLRVGGVGPNQFHFHTDLTEIAMVERVFGPDLPMYVVDLYHFTESCFLGAGKHV
jgi:hypothetical protein